MMKRHFKRAGQRAKILSSLNEESNYHKIKNFLEKERKEKEIIQKTGLKIG